MLRRKLLLLSLFTAMALTGALAQVNVHGTVTDINGSPVENVNIIVNAIFSDSTVYFESVYTGADGMYEVELPSPPLNLIGFVQVSMVDCWGIVVTQNFTIFNGPNDLEANFTYCDQFPVDSCQVLIFEEWVPGSNTTLVAWTPFNIPLEYVWSTGETTQSIVPQESGEYCVTVEFPWGCTDSNCYEYVEDSTGLCFTYILSTSNNDGTYDLEAVPTGTAPFIFAWNTTDSTQILEDVGPGTYCVTVIDALGCVYTACVFIDDFNFCEVWISQEPNGGLVAQGYGEPPFSYIWNTGDSSQTIYPNAEGLYCVTVTDQNQCSASSCYYYGNNYDSCYVFVTVVYLDTNTIGLQAIPSTGAQSVTYLWNTGETTDIIYPFDPSQTYCVTITDSDSCVASACFEPYYYCYAWADVQYIDTTTAVLSVYTDPIFNLPGNNNTTYLWSTGDTTETITVNASGNYCVTVSLNADCTTEACVYVDFDSLGTQCAAWVIQYPDSTGQWYAEVFAWGFGDFTYLWTTGDTTPVIELTNPNQFVCVTATSSFGCVTEACVDTFFNPCKAYISVNYLGNDIAVLEAFSWNAPPQNASYVWSNGETGPVITVNQEGTYCVTVTGGGCVSEACVEVLFWNFDSCGVWVIEEQLPTGYQYTAEAWGVAPYTYIWSNGSTEQSQFLEYQNLQLCVTVTDATGCVSVGCPDPNGGGINVITGFVFADTLLNIEGFVYAHAVDPNGGVFQLVDSAQIVGGAYRFDALPSGLYVLKAEITAGTAGFGEYIPTYHLSSPSWEAATYVSVPDWLPYTKDIWMIPVDTTNGTGVIGGVVTDPNHLMAEENGDFRGETGISGITVLLKDAAGKPLNYTVSLQDGTFRFTGLPYGTYRISYDIPGISSPDVWVTLTPNNPELLQVSLILTEGTVSVDEPEAIPVELYPNPARENVTIKIPGDNQEYHIQIVDMNGRVVATGSVKSQNSIMLIDVEQFSPGLYHVNLRDENTYYTGRFVKQE